MLKVDQGRASVADRRRRRGRLTAPRDVAVADDGTLYISDTGNARIVKSTRCGNRSTFAGGGDPDTLGDGGPATAARP